MNYENLFYALGGILNFEIIISFTAYDAIKMILDYKKEFLNLTLFEAAFIIFCWPEVLYLKMFGGKKPFYQRTLKEIFFPKRAKTEEIAKKLEKDADN